MDELQGDYMRTYFRSLISLGVACAALVSLDAHAAKVYKWVDDQGGVHLTAQPPTGREFQEIAVSTGHSAPPAANQETSPQEASTSGTEAAASSATKKDAKVCTAAKGNLEALSHGGQIRMKDQYGGERILSEEDISAQKKRAQDAIKLNCD